MEESKRRPKRSRLEVNFARNWSIYAPGYPLADDRDSLKLPFANSGRRFLADFVHVETKVAIELQGGIWTGGKHGRGPGIATDALKLAIAQRNGWQLYQVVPGAERELMPVILGAICDRGGIPIPSQKKSIETIETMENPF